MEMGKFGFDQFLISVGGDVMDLRFISGNQCKISEAEEILSPIGLTVIPVKVKIDELQTTDTRKLVRDKTLKAFKIIGRPLFVEHTGLHLERLKGFPGGLTEIFWNTLEADTFAELYADSNAIARTVIGYCDGKGISYFEGEIEGTIASTPRGDRTFQWDCVFVPVGESMTFAEMGHTRKNEISMRRRALDVFARELGVSRRA